MTALGDARRALVDVIVSAVPESVPVYEAWPSNVSAPCVVVTLRDGEQLGPALWMVTLRAALIAGGGDGVANLAQLEDLIERVVPALSQMYAQHVTWDAPGSTSVAGQQLLASEVDVTLDLALGE